jgi:hypothetical protein
MNTPSLLPTAPIHRVDLRTAEEQAPGSILATDDSALIREWARRHAAEPATGEATQSGPATVDVHDGGTGIRFNFPGVAKYRPITWDEWFENFRQYDLVFLFERDTPGKTPSGRYRIVTKATLRESRGDW